MKKLMAIVLILSASIRAGGTDSPSISFSHLSTADGLLPGSITDFHFDANGIVWISSGGGLCCYDGHTATPIAINEDDADSAAHSTSILRLAGDGKHTLFAACRKEIWSLDLLSSEIKTISGDDSRAIFHYNDSLYVAVGKELKRYAADGTCSILHISENDGSYTAMLHSADGRIWLGTDNGILSRYPDGARWDAGSFVESIYEDSRGLIWVGTMSDGLLKIDAEGSVTSYRSNGPGTLSSDFVRSICEDDAGILWVGTFHGLNRLEISTGGVTSFHSDSSRPDAISNDSVWQIKKDSQGTLWAGTFFGGVNFFNPGREIYTRYDDIGAEGSALSSPVIGKIEEGRDGTIWVATEGGGLNSLDCKTGKTRWFRKENGFLPENNIKDFHLDNRSGTIWIGTHLGGVCRMDIHSGRTTTIHPSIIEGATIDADDILCIECCRDTLYIGSVGGLFTLDLQSGHLGRSALPCRDSHTAELFTDNSSRLWISADDRISRYDPASGRTETILEKVSAAHIFQDSKGRIWICSLSHGIYRYLPWEERAEYIPLADRWPATESPRCIAESPKSGTIYILGYSGILEIEPDSDETTYNNFKTGFPIRNTNARALTVSNGGTIYAGGTDGLLSFREDDFRLPQIPYRLFFTRLFVDGKLERPDGAPILQYSREIVIPAKASMFSVEYASSNYIPNKQTETEYMLDGFSKDWTTSNGNSPISYSNIPPGTYTLRIRPKDTADGICPTAEIKVRILSPWYRTTLALSVYLLLILVSVYGLARFLRDRIKLKESLHYEKKHAEDIEALNQSKLRFFTNISHEIRTPLTMIIAEIEALMQGHNYTPSQYNKVLAIYKNSLSLKELISELLEFRKQEQGQLKIKVAAHNIVYFTNEFHLLFGEYASSKGVNLRFEKETERLEVWYDQKQMQKVLNNILSNSLKFTEKGGTITIRVYSESSNAIISISDTGCGIPASEIDKIFNRFYQVDSTDPTNAGTGIGLSLALGIVQLHKGRIDVSSSPDGSTFKIVLPLGYSHFSKEQIDAATLPDKKPDGLPDIKRNDKETGIGQKASRKDHSIVIAEDNEDIREMLSELFNPVYTVFTAENGEEALELVRKEQPSIVISDVVMPKMSGTELCRRIKGDMTTCHIPVVLLTARVDIEQNLEGLQTGADDYITKPFNSALLISRCNNLVNSRLLLQEKFSTQLQTSAWALATNEMDKNFLDKAMETIRRNCGLM